MLKSWVRMEKNKRGKANALDLVELIVVIVLGWIGKKLLDSLWKGMIGAFRKIFAGRNSNEARRSLLYELGYKILLFSAHILEVGEEQAKLAIDQAIHTKDPTLTSGLKILAMLLKSSLADMTK